MAKSNETTTKQEFQEAAHGCSTILPAKSTGPHRGHAEAAGGEGERLHPGGGFDEQGRRGEGRAQGGGRRREGGHGRRPAALQQAPERTSAARGARAIRSGAQFGMKGRKRSSSTATSRAAGAKQAVATRKAHWAHRQAAAQGRGEAREGGGHGHGREVATPATPERVLSALPLRVRRGPLAGRRPAALLAHGAGGRLPLRQQHWAEQQQLVVSLRLRGALKFREPPQRRARGDRPVEKGSAMVFALAGRRPVL